MESENSIKKIFQCNSLFFSILDIRNPVLRICKWLVLYLISCWYDMKQSKTCTKIIKLWYLSGYWSFHQFIRISSYSLPTPNFITGKFVHFKLENLGDWNSLIDLRYLGNLMTKVWTGPEMLKFLYDKKKVFSFVFFWWVDTLHS